VRPLRALQGLRAKGRAFGLCAARTHSSHPLPESLFVLQLVHSLWVSLITRPGKVGWAQVLPWPRSCQQANHLSRIGQGQKAGAPANLEKVLDTPSSGVGVLRDLEPLWGGQMGKVPRKRDNFLCQISEQIPISSQMGPCLLLLQETLSGLILQYRPGQWNLRQASYCFLYGGPNTHGHRLICLPHLTRGSKWLLSLLQPGRTFGGCWCKLKSKHSNRGPSEATSNTDTASGNCSHSGQSRKGNQMGTIGLSP